MTRRALVVTHTGRKDAGVASDEAVAELEAVGIEPVHETDWVEGIDGLEFAVVLGGDGTILRAAEITRGTGIPLLGINLGHVGFLAESERDHIGAAVRRLAAGDYDVDERGTLDVRTLLPGADV